MIDSGTGLEYSSWRGGPRGTPWLILAAVSLAPGSAADLAAEIGSDQPDAHVVLLTDPDSIDELRQACGPEPEILAKPFDLEAVAHAALSRWGSADHTVEA